MKQHRIEITKTAQKQLDKLPVKISNLLVESIMHLSIDPRPVGCIKLKNRDGYRIRKGDYRIIYNVFDNVLVVEIIAVGHRKAVYD
ncbi:MAG: type II toxin-antitoxin system RelE family toxin [Flavobacteriales bacterium]